MVSSCGRVFYIIDDAPLFSMRFPCEWKIMARDAFNGKKLWERPVSSWVSKYRIFRAGARPPLFRRFGLKRPAMVMG